MTKQILLIDGSSFLYRSYYALKPMHTIDGVPIQAVFGFCRMFKKLIDAYKPQSLALVWDSPGRTVRHEVFAGYKATRQAPPSDLFAQKKMIQEFADIIGVPQVAREGVEADDLLCSLTHAALKEDYDVLLVTADKDMMQLLSDKVRMYDVFKDLVIDAQSAQEILGFPISKLIFYYALLGDSSDNIPGVKGIGKKGALDLVNQFESLDDLYTHIEKVEKPRTKTVLIENKDDAYLSLELFTLQCPELQQTMKDFAFDVRDWNKARAFFETLNFQSLLKQMNTTLSEPGSAPDHIALDHVVHVITEEHDLHELVQKIREVGTVALDTETTGLSPIHDVLVGISLCIEEGAAYYIPCAHTTGEKQLPKELVINILAPLLADPKVNVIMHHAKFDYEVLESVGAPIAHIAFDTLIAAHLTLPAGTRIKLKLLSLYFFKERMLTFSEVVMKAGYKSFNQVPIEQGARYACADAHQTFKLYHKLKPMLVEMQLESLYYDIELPLVTVLAAMERAGIALDTVKLQDVGKKVSLELVEVEDTIMRIIGDEHASINLNSPRQIEHLLFNTLKLPPQKKSGGGRYSTDADVLERLVEMSPVPGLILQYRELSKLKSTYIDSLPTFCDPRDGRVHTTFSQTQTATGRLASSEPNLQNIPADNDRYGGMIREAFYAPDGHLFISADYSQIELRILAYFSQDPALLEAFKQGHDIHAQTAAGLFKVPFDQVTHEQRQIGKRINFSILYGLTPYGLSQDLKIPLSTAKAYITDYFAHYPKVREWMDGVIEFAKKHGYVQTHFGRKRTIPTIYERNRTLYEEACRIAINTCAQGTAADIVKISMLKLRDRMRERPDEAQMLLQIHDELIVQVRDKHVDEWTAIIKKELESVVSWNVPLVVGTQIGRTWKDVSK